MRALSCRAVLLEGKQQGAHRHWYGAGAALPILK